jgi:hypothetical protein
MSKRAKSSGLAVVLVEWRDASSEEGPLLPGELTPCVELRTAGILVREDADSVSVAQDYCPADERFRKVIHIPRPMIRAVRRLKG